MPELIHATPARAVENSKSVALFHSVHTIINVALAAAITALGVLMLVKS